MLTLNEIIERLGQRYDPEELCELMEITAPMLLEKFDYLVDFNYDKLNEELQDD